MNASEGFLKFPLSPKHKSLYESFHDFKVAILSATSP
jgi:hypothetical protein